MAEQPPGLSAPHVSLGDFPNWYRCLPSITRDVIERPGRLYDRCPSQLPTHWCQGYDVSLSIFTQFTDSTYTRMSNESTNVQTKCCNNANSLDRTYLSLYATDISSRHIVSRDQEMAIDAPERPGVLESRTSDHYGRNYFKRQSAFLFE
jgi:hypothetical protein